MSPWVPAAIGVLTAVTWGTGDFIGGVAARKGAPALAVAMLGQSGSCLLMGILVLFSGQPAPDRHTILWALSVGIGSATGTSCLYAALASGAMALAAPVSAIITAALPVLASAILEGTPTPLHVAGFVIAAVAIWLLSRGDTDLGHRGLGLALLAGLGFGWSLVSMHLAGLEQTVWPLFLARTSGTTILLALCLLRRVPLLQGGRLRALAISTGLFDTMGNGLFTVATRLGRLDVMGSLASLYPASTLILARIVYGERTRPIQRVGLGLAAVAVLILTQ